MEVRAAVLERAGGPFSVERLAPVELPDHALLVRTRTSGVCGTDLHVRSGSFAPEFGFPVVLGHEAAGSVEAVGGTVRGFAVGDRVAITANLPCGDCSYCRRGEGYNCARSDEIAVRNSLRRPSGRFVHPYFGIGSLAEYVLVPATAAFRLPDDVPWEVGSVLACAGQTGLGSVFNVARVAPGRSAAVFGCGPVGLCAVLALEAAGAAPVVAVDRRAARLRLARRLGAERTVLRTPGTRFPLRHPAFGNGVEFAFECHGSARTMREAFSVLAPGGTLVVVGAAPTGSRLELDPGRLLADRRVHGSRAGSVDLHRDYPRWLDRWRAGELPLDALVGRRRYRLDDVGRAFEDMARGRVVKPIVVP